ncbi:MAG: FAD/NAD(P)-binding protein [Bacteroidetes bacterium]|nr:FAD/NAD(P)-binding protein [Bacteroidota bacterium]
MKKIVIVGGGLSGTLVALNLLRASGSGDLSITLVEKKQAGLLGQAYSTNEDLFLLNVPAGKMSAFASDPLDFYNWLLVNNPGHNKESFVPRKWYREYIWETLNNSIKKRKTNIHFFIVNDEAYDVVPGLHLLLLSSGQRLEFDTLILALGNHNPASLEFSDNRYLNHPRYYGSTWDETVFRKRKPGNNVFIIGTGLTMVDTTILLSHSNPAISIKALSTHGFTPMPHLETEADELKKEYRLPSDEINNLTTSSEVFAVVRKHIRAAATEQIKWQTVVDSIRPFTQSIWMRFPVEEKKRFMQHIRHIWGVLRHRIPAQSAKWLNNLKAENRFSITAGRIRSVTLSDENTFEITYRPRHSLQNQTIFADTLINCMGPDSNFENIENPLVRNLLASGLIRTDKLKLGLDCNETGALIDCKGTPSPSLFTIGPPAKGVFFEITGVPEIRVAAEKLADHLRTDINNPVLST